jgi:hypothetical protein
VTCMCHVDKDIWIGTEVSLSISLVTMSVHWFKSFNNYISFISFLGFKRTCGLLSPLVFHYYQCLCMLTPFSLKLLGQIKNILSLVDLTEICDFGVDPKFRIVSWANNAIWLAEHQSSIVFKNYILWFNGAWIIR